MFCIHCGQQISEDSAFCIACGQKAENETVTGSFCIQCGQMLPEDSAFCTACGAKAVDELGVPEAQPITEPETEPAMPVFPPNVTEPKIQPKETVIPDVPPKNVQGTQSGGNPKSLVIILAAATLTLLLVVAGLIVFIMINREHEEDHLDIPDLPGVQVGLPGADLPDGEVVMTHVNKVRSGHFINHQDITIGTAFDIYFTETYWVPSFAEGVNYVSFMGVADINDERTGVQFVFQFDDDDALFRAVLLLFDGMPQDVLVMDDFVDEIFNTVRMRG